AVAVICRRSQLLSRISGQGEMAVVELTQAEAAELLAGYEDRLSVAANNGPRSTVISGDPAALGEGLAGGLARGGLRRQGGGVSGGGEPQRAGRAAGRRAGKPALGAPSAAGDAGDALDGDRRGARRTGAGGGLLDGEFARAGAVCRGGGGAHGRGPRAVRGD